VGERRRVRRGCHQEIIENSSRYQDWKDHQEEGEDNEAKEELGTYLEPFELYKLLAYDTLGGNVSTRDSPLYYFQTIGYESAREKLAQYNGCIISDSVGLGKSFIGGELLYDYRQQENAVYSSSLLTSLTSG